MKKIFLLSLIAVFGLSCRSDIRSDLIQKIKTLEYQRPRDADIFDIFLQDNDYRIRQIAVESLGKIQNPVYLSKLSLMLSDPNPHVKEATIFSIGQIPSDSSEIILSHLLGKPDFRFFQSKIIEAIGRCGGSNSLNLLSEQLPQFSDSLKAGAIQALTFIYSRDRKQTSPAQMISGYLAHSSDEVRTQACYYFSRNPEIAFRDSLLKMRADFKSLAYKYRLKSLSRMITSIQDIPDSLITNFKNELFESEVDDSATSGQTQIYQHDLLAIFPDSVTVDIISINLNSHYLHTRVSAIRSLGKCRTSYAQSKLIESYNAVGWEEKGEIIKVLSKLDPQLAHRLIQQNLDQGTLYFKQLLLSSLAEINDTLSVELLRQFLNVPNIQLNSAAFENLSEKDHITYSDAKLFLQSGDPALTAHAADWISNHPQKSQLEDLISAYQKFHEPEDIEPMMTILSTIKAVKSENAISFLQSVYQNAQNELLVNIAQKALEDLSVAAKPRIGQKTGLFIPDNIDFSGKTRFAVIDTDKGILKLELFSSIAPLTVANFINLAEKGFFNSLVFHRVVSDFVIQGGDPRGDGWGGPGYSIPCEYNPIKFDRGTVGMATAGKDTGGSQFFICHSEQPHLIGRYTVFGRLVEGFNVLDSIQKNDNIISVKILN